MFNYDAYPKSISIGTGGKYTKNCKKENTTFFYTLHIYHDWPNLQN